MKPFTRQNRTAGATAALAMFLITGDVLAHCDTMDGPIVPEAQAALERGDITPVLKWVTEGDEAAVQDAFQRARAVRDQGAEVRNLADQFFLETLIRIHRQGEGAPFTGLKPAGTVAPAFVAADAALDSGNANELAGRIGSAIQAEIRRRFAVALERHAHADDSVEAGRAYVEAYVTYLHFVEELHSLLEPGSATHDRGPVVEHTH